MGHLMKLAKGIAELSDTATPPATLATNTDTPSVVVTDALKPQPAGINDTNSDHKDLKDLKDLNFLAPVASAVPLAQAVGQAQLIAEAAGVIHQCDDVAGLNKVLTSAAVANKIAEVIRCDGLPLTLCMLAAKHGRIGCMQRLLGELAAQQTIDTTRVDDGCTALHLAAYSGSAGCVKLLLQAGANTNLVNCYGETPLDCAVKQSHSSILDVFAQATGNGPAITPSNDSQKTTGRSVARILQPRRHTKKSRDTLANELSAWRNGNVARAA